MSPGVSPALAGPRANDAGDPQSLRAVCSGSDDHQPDWREAELYRLKGELLLTLSRDHQAAAEACYHQALDVARRQQARSLELRAATSLSRLWQQQGKRREACQRLAEIYGWFTEGFDTADLQEARALLEALRQHTRGEDDETRYGPGRA
jgi:predicted ATPase